MSQDAINQRIKILIEALGMNIRSFSLKLGVSDSTTRNYIDKGSKPPAEYIATVASSIDRVNPSWLLLGQGEMFLDGSAEVQVVDAKRGGGLAELEKELAAVQKQNDLLQNQLLDKSRIIKLLEQQTVSSSVLMAAQLLEIHLRLLALTHNIVSSSELDKKYPSELNTALVAAKVYKPAEGNQVRTWIEMRNQAAHSVHISYSLDEAQAMYQGVVTFISRTRQA